MIRNKSTLAKSVAILTAFYSVVFLWVFSFTPPSTLASLFEAMPEFLKIGAEAPDPEANILMILPEQIKLMKAWSLPVLSAWGGAVVTGLVFAGLLGAVFGKKRKLREVPSGDFRGIGVTIGRAAMPVLPKKSAIYGVDAHIKLDKKEQALADEIFSILNAWKEHYAGDGHGVSLLDHTFNVLESVVEDSRCDSTLFLIAAAHDLGKITSFRKMGRGWVRTRLHAQESARLLGLMESWWALPVEQREVIRLAVKYDHSPDLAAEYPEYDEKLRFYMETLADIDGRVTGQEKEKVLEKVDLETLAVETLLSHVHRGNFYQKNLPRGAESIGFCFKKRLYLFEGPLRKFLTSYVDKDVVAASMSYRTSGSLSPFTIALLRGLSARGLLVTRYEEGWSEGKPCELPVDSAIWDVDAWGTKDKKKRWRAVIVLKPEVGELSLNPPEAPFLKLDGFAPNKPGEATWLTDEEFEKSRLVDDGHYRRLKDALPVPSKESLDQTAIAGEPEKATKERRKTNSQKGKNLAKMMNRAKAQNTPRSEEEKSPNDGVEGVVEKSAEPREEQVTCFTERSPESSGLSPESPEAEDRAVATAEAESAGQECSKKTEEKAENTKKAVLKAPTKSMSGGVPPIPAAKRAKRRASKPSVKGGSPDELDIFT